MKYQVVFRDKARNEALAAAAYIAERGAPRIAQSWYDGLVKAIASLSTQPRRCGRARESADFPHIELRQLRYKSHRLIFRITGDQVDVLHVRHARQDKLRRL